MLEDAPAAFVGPKPEMIHTGSVQQRVSYTRRYSEESACCKGMATTTTATTACQSAVMNDPMAPRYSPHDDAAASQHPMFDACYASRPGSPKTTLPSPSAPPAPLSAVGSRGARAPVAVEGTLRRASRTATRGGRRHRHGGGPAVIPDPRETRRSLSPTQVAYAGLGRVKAYTEARRYIDTDGAGGLPCIAFGRTLRVPTAMLLANSAWLRTATSRTGDQPVNALLEAAHRGTQTRDGSSSPFMVSPKMAPARVASCSARRPGEHPRDRERPTMMRPPTPTRSRRGSAVRQTRTSSGHSNQPHLLAIDVDPRNGGSLADLQHAVDLPGTLTARDRWRRLALGLRRSQASTCAALSTTSDSEASTSSAAATSSLSRADTPRVGTYTWLTDDEPAPVPDPLLDLLRRPEPSPPPAGAVPGGPLSRVGVAYVEAALQRAHDICRLFLRMVVDNNALAKEAFSIGGLPIGRDKATAVLWHACEVCGLVADEPIQTLRTLDRQLNEGSKRPRVVPARLLAADSAGRAMTTREVRDVVASTAHRRSAVMEAHDAEVTTLLREFPGSRVVEAFETDNGDRRRSLPQPTRESSREVLSEDEAERTRTPSPSPGTARSCPTR